MTVSSRVGVSPDVRITVPDLVLERYRLGELPPAQVAELKDRLQRDPALQARLDALAASDADIQASGFTRQLAATVTASEGGQSKFSVSESSNWRVALAAVAVVVVSILGVWQPWSRYPGQPGGATSDSGDRVKGDSALVLYRKTGPGSELLAEGATGRSGDLIRVGYRIGNACFGVIVSIDGSGVVTRHLPVSGDAAPALQAGGVTLLEAAYELDAAPGWEQFFLITRETEFSVQSVVDAARVTTAASAASPPATLALGAGFQQTSFTLRKPR